MYEVEGGLKAVEHQHDERRRDALVARGRELVGPTDGPVVLVALKVDFLLGRACLFTKARMPSLERLACEQLLREVLDLFAFGPTGPLGFFSSLAEALLEEAASAARGAADGFEPGRNPPRSVAAGSLLLPGLPAAAPAPFAPGKPGGFLLLLLLLLPRGVLLPARGVVEPFLEPPPPSGLLRGEAARGDLPLFALLVLPVRSVSETPDAEPSLVASSGVLRCVDAIGGLESAASAYSNLGPKQKRSGPHVLRRLL